MLSSIFAHLVIWYYDSIVIAVFLHIYAYIRHVPYYIILQQVFLFIQCFTVSTPFVQESQKTRKLYLSIVQNMNRFKSPFWLILTEEKNLPNN